MTDTSRATALPEHICWQLLRSAEVGRLAVCSDGIPDILPVNFVVDQGTIVFRTAAGTKLSAARRYPRVAFEVDGYDTEADQAWSVVIKGRATEIVRLHDRIESHELPLFPWHGEAKGHFVRIEPASTTGRRFRVSDSTAWSTPATGARRAPAE